MITLSQLQSICKTADGRNSCGQYVDAMNQYLPLYRIDTQLRIIGFIAQVAHESGDFTRVTENLNYSAKGLAGTWPSRYTIRNPETKELEPNALALSLHRKPEAIANNVYANRMGNSNEASGDGWRYRGRGLKQLTGKSNYEACAADTGLPIVQQPDLLELPEGAVVSACWFWESNNLNRFADKCDFKGLTRAINGGLIGYEQRLEYLDKCEKVF